MADERTAAQIEYNEALEQEAIQNETLQAVRKIAADELKKSSVVTEETKNKLKELNSTLAEATAHSTKLGDALNLAADQGTSMADAFARASGMTQNFEKSMLGATIGILSSDDAMNSFTDKLQKNFSAQKIGLNILSKFAEATLDLALKTDQSLVAFNKQTGATKEYGTQIRALERTMFQHGVGIEESAEAYGSLFTNVTALGRMSKSTQKELATTTGLLSHLGVSADTTAANVQFMTRSLGVSVGEASKYQRQLFTLAQEIGMPPEEMAAGFKAAAPKLAAFGKQAGKVFMKLAKNARAAGMEVDQLLNITEQFDTFEGAAESVGKLNALLGGPFLNSMEMVQETDPTERMRMLSGALNDAGKSFEQMTYYEKKSIAAAAGLSDVNELSLLMADSFDKAAGGAFKSQAEIKALEKQSKDFNTMAEELTQTMKMFALELYPIIERIKLILQGMQAWYPMIKTATPAILGLAAALTVAGAGIDLTRIKLMFFTASWKLSPMGKITLIITSLMTLAQWFPKVAIGIGFVTAAVWAATAGFTALNTVTAGIPIVIGALVTLLAYLAQMLWGTDVGHSTFHEALDKMAITFDTIASAIGGLMGAMFSMIPTMFKFLTPFGILMTMWESIMGSSKETEKNMSRMSTTKPLARATDAVNNDSLKAATAAAKPPVYKSDTPDGVTSKSGSSNKGASAAAPQKVEIKITTGTFFDRFLDAKIVNQTGKALNSNQGGG